MSDANGGRDTGPSGLKTKIDVAPYSILPRAPLFVITAKETKLEPSPSEYQAAKRVRVDTTSGPALGAPPSSPHAAPAFYAHTPAAPAPTGSPPAQILQAPPHPPPPPRPGAAPAPPTHGPPPTGHPTPMPPTPAVQPTYDPYGYYQQQSQYVYHPWGAPQGAAPYHGGPPPSNGQQTHPPPYYYPPAPPGPPSAPQGYGQYSHPPGPYHYPQAPGYQGYPQAPGNQGYPQAPPVPYGHPHPHMPYPQGAPAYPAPPPPGAPPPHTISAPYASQGQSHRQPLDAAKSRAILINKRITSATTAKEILDIVNYELDAFDPVAIATAVHRLASLRGAPNLHEQITRAPEFFKLMRAVRDRAHDLHMRNVANIVWGFAKMNHLPDEEIMQALCREIRKKAMDGVAQNIANTLWALSSLQYRPDDATLAALANAALAKISDFSSQHISNVVLSFAKMDHAIDPDILQALGREALAKLGTFTAQALSNTLWGLSKLGIADGDLFSSVAAAARATLPSFNSQNLANSIWAYGNLQINPGEDVLSEYAAYCIRSMDTFTPQNVSNVVWAFAKLGYFNADLFKAASWRGLETMHAFTPQSVANFLWAYATIDKPPEPAFLRAAVAHSLGQLDQWAPQNLSNVAWALACLKKSHEAVIEGALASLLPSVVGEVTRRLLDPEKEKIFSRQHLANYIWALATAEYDPGEVALRAAAESLRTRLSLCIPQELTNACSGFAKLKYYDGSLMEDFAAEAVSRIDEFEAQNLAQMVWAFAKMNYYHTDLMAAVAAATAAGEVCGEMLTPHLVITLHAYATLNAASPQLFNAIIAELLKRLQKESLPASSAAQILWAAAVADVLERSLWDACLAQIAVSDVPIASLEPESTSQIFQAWMLLQARHGDQEWPIDAALLKRGEETWKASVLDVTISNFHSEVSRTLHVMGIDHRLEHLTEDGLFSVDVALPAEHIALEVDGPHHFTRNSLRPMGEMFTRATLLEARGWKVASVPFFRWAGVDDEGRRTLLANLLDRVRTGLPAHPTQEVQGRGQRGAAKP